MIDYEAQLLKLYTDRDGMRKLLDYGLKEENIAALNEDAAAVFRTAREWFQKKGGSPITWDALLEDHEQYIKVHQESVSDVSDEDVEPSWLVRKLQTRYLFSKFKTRAEEANRDGTFDSDLTYEDALVKAKEFTRDLMRITVTATSDRPLSPMSEALPAFVEDTLTWDDKIASGDAKPPVTFGFVAPPTVVGPDEAYGGGLRQGELAVISAYTKVGKSFIVCQSALRAAKTGKRVAFFTLENSEEETYARLTALAARLPYGHVSGKTLHNGEREKFRALVGDDVFERLFIKQPMGKSAATLEEMYWQAYDVDADLFIGDQFSHVFHTTGRKGDPDWLVEGEKALEARRLSKETGMPSIWVSQLNRGAHKKKSPGSSDMARSLGIVQGADFSFYAAPVDNNPDLRTFACREARRGPALNWEMRVSFDPMEVTVNRTIAL